MSKKANTTLIGIFVFIGLILAVFAIAFFGSIKIFSESETFVLYFDESVNGLDVGAKVKWKGVPIGEVTEILVRWNQDELSDHVPVFMDIDVTKLVNQLGVSADLRDEGVYAAQLNLGLRARLQMESMVTGKYFIELDYIENPQRPNFIQDEDKLKEIPTVPSAFAAIGESATSIVARISSLNFRAINDELLALLGNLNDTLETIDVERIQESVVAASDSIRLKVESINLDSTFESLNKTLAEYRRLAASIEEKLDPGSEEFKKTASELRNTLIALQDTTQSLRDVLAPEGAFRYEFEATFTRISDAAIAIKNLADYLERNPKGLITGKSVPSDSP